MAFDLGASTTRSSGRERSTSVRSASIIGRPAHRQARCSYGSSVRAAHEESVELGLELLHTAARQLPQLVRALRALGEAEAVPEGERGVVDRCFTASDPAEARPLRAAERVARPEPADAAQAGEPAWVAVLAQELLDYDTLRGDTDARRRAAHAARLGDLSLKVNDPSGAAMYFLRAADNGDVNLLARAADAQLRAGDANAALGTAAKVLEKDPANALAQSVLKRAKN